MFKMVFRGRAAQVTSSISPLETEVGHYGKDAVSSQLPTAKSVLTKGKLLFLIFYVNFFPEEEHISAPPPLLIYFSLRWE